MNFKQNLFEFEFGKLPVIVLFLKLIILNPVYLLKWSLGWVYLLEQVLGLNLASYCKKGFLH